MSNTESSGPDADTPDAPSLPILENDLAAVHDDIQSLRANRTLREAFRKTLTTELEHEYEVAADFLRTTLPVAACRVESLSPDSSSTTAASDCAEEPATDAETGRPISLGICVELGDECSVKTLAEQLANADLPLSICAIHDEGVVVQ